MIIPMPIIIPAHSSGWNGSSGEFITILIICILVVQWVVSFGILYTDYGELTKKQFLLSLIPFWFIITFIQWFIKAFKELE